MKNLGRIMLARRTMVGMVAGGAALLLIGCGESENALRYKMTVEVDTPQGVKSGSAVREMMLNSDNLVGGPNPPDCRAVRPFLKKIPLPTYRELVGGIG